MFYFRKEKFLSHKGWKVIIPASVMAFLALSFLVYFAAYPYILKKGSEEIRRRISRFSEKFNLVVNLKNLKMSLADDLVLEGISVYDYAKENELLYIENASFSFSFFDLLKGTKIPESIRIENFILKTEYGNWRFTALDNIREKLRSGGSGAEEKSDWRFPYIELVSGKIAVYEGEEDKVIFSAGRINGSVKLDGSKKSAALTGFLFDEDACPFSAFVFYDSTGRLMNWDWDSECQLNPSEIFRLDLPSVSFRKFSGSFAPGSGNLDFSMTDAAADTEKMNFFDPLWKRGVKTGIFNAGEIRASLMFDPLAIKGRLGKENVQKILIKRGKGEFLLVSGRSEKKYIAEGLEFNLEKEGDNFMLNSGGFVISSRGNEGGFSFSGKVNSDFIPFEGRFSTEGRLLALAASHFIKQILLFDDSFYRLHVDFSGEPDAPAFKGDLKFKNAGLFFTKLCLVPLEGLTGEMRFSGGFGLPVGVFRLDLEEFRLNNALFKAGVVVKEIGKKPLLDLVFSVPKQSCQSLIESVPPVMIPRLEGIKLDGTIDLSFKLHLNLREIQKTNIEIEGNFDDCRTVTLGRMIDLEKLNKEFVHSIYIDEKTERIKVGPSTGDFVPLEEIPEPVWQAALATEDMGFFKHKGFKLGLIKRAIKLDLEKGWFVYGGSTISQQLVKNLFLSREKTLARKFEEAIITWEMERSVKKERILELYLNCIEFGTNVFGIKKAAQVYFNKLPLELTPLEAAFIMAAKPDPRYAYNIYKKRLFNEWWIERMRFILERMWKEMGVIDEETYLSLAPYIPKFHYPEEELLKKTEEPQQEQSDLLEDF